MIRFRSIDDERRYQVLKAESFRRITGSGLSDEVASQVMRNLGKIEMMLFIEGIRQGLAMAAVAREAERAASSADPMAPSVPAMPDPNSFKAFQLHAIVYGSSDTPLRVVEKEWMGRLGLADDHLATSWLDDKPMRFAPMTVAEAMGEAKPESPVYKMQAPNAPIPMRQAPLQSEESDPLAELMAKLTEPKADPQPDDDRPESPDFLDNLRDHITAATKSGWKPASWADLILHLHQRTGFDAAFLDLQLSTDVGRTVLDQCGLMGIAPGMAIMFSDIVPKIVSDES